MEIEQIKQLKRDLEYHILLKVSDFEAKTGQTIKEIGITITKVYGIGKVKPKNTGIELTIEL